MEQPVIARLALSIVLAIAFVISPVPDQAFVTPPPRPSGLTSNWAICFMKTALEAVLPRLFRRITRGYQLGQPHLLEAQ